MSRFKDTTRWSSTTGSRATLLSDRDFPGEAERKLRRVGGVWKEPLSFPLDPEFLFQRTGYACMDEDGVSAGTAESENAWQLFDQDLR